jgi:hypothetical protein
LSGQGSTSSVISSKLLQWNDDSTVCACSCALIDEICIGRPLCWISFTPWECVVYIAFAIQTSYLPAARYLPAAHIPATCMHGWGRRGERKGGGMEGVREVEVFCPL